MKQKRKNAFESLTKELTKVNSNQKDTSNDDRFWSPTVNKDGNGSAIIRFLPASDGETIPFVRIWNHGFNGPTGLWYIENSLTTIGQPDPVSEYNTLLWNSGLEENKKIVREKQKRKLSFYSNIYVVKDPGNPENEGKVFLYRYGKKIFDKINDLMNPSDEFGDQERVNPFDLWEGANFRLRVTRVGEYPNYDKSSFDSPSPLLDDDNELEAIYKSQYKLQDLLAPSQFKSYDELKAKLEKVLNTSISSAPAEQSQSTKSFEMEAPSFKTKESVTETKFNTSVVEEDDDDLEFFRKLKEED